MASTADSLTPIRTLSPMESTVMGWVEADRRNAITIDEVSEQFAWKRDAVRSVLFRLARKGWLRRTARGRYETVLAETAGYAPPNPWVALASWIPKYYVAFQSAAYEHNLTPDRPGDVQVAVADWTIRPRAWAEIPIALIHLRTFSTEGIGERTINGSTVAIASQEKVLCDSALLPARVGEVRGLARIVARAIESADWREVVRLTENHPWGSAALRRLGALIEVLGMPVPEPLPESALRSAGGVKPILLGTSDFESEDGDLLERWKVIVNVDADDLREELRR